MNVTTYLSLVLTMLLWGGTFIAGRLLAGSVPPVNVAFLRFVIASVVLALMVRLIDGKIPVPPRNQWISLILLGVTGIFSYNLFFFNGLKYIDAGRAALIIALNPIVITIAAVVFLGERLSGRQFIGICISLIGALFVISNGNPGAIFSGGFGLGEGLILGCVFSWTAYALIGRRVLVSLTPLVSVFYSTLIGSFLLFPFSLRTDLIHSIPMYTYRDWSSIIFLGLLATAVGVSLYYRAIHKLGAARASVFINLVPLFSILLSWLILGEEIKPSVLGCGFVLLFGVYLANSKPKSRAT